MHTFVKQLLSLAFVFVLMAGTALAQNNESIITQNSSGSEATVYQDGSDNYSTLSQSDDFIGGHTATIEQVGTNNWSELQTQNGGGTAEVTMTGDNNSLVDWKDRTRGGFGANQKNSLTSFDLDVTGSDNTVGMTQEFAIGDVDIVGDGNQVGLRQLSGANYQVGDFHTANIVIGGDGSTGNHNTVTVNQASEQGGTGGVNNGATVKVLRGDGNTVEATQFGSDNRQTIEVDGSNNTYTAAQTGSDNALYLNSRGTGQYFSGAGGVSGNAFSLTQDGTGNLVDAGLDGVNNSITITQHGTGNVVDGPAAGRFDADGLGIIGDNNSVTVMQSGSGHAAEQMVMGNNNHISVTQSD
jgi:hypothetical protein